MNMWPRSATRSCRQSGRPGWRGAIGASLMLLVGCGANGDFGRERPSLVPDIIHDWFGGKAVQGTGEPASTYNRTADEGLLRDLAALLLEPPLDQRPWYGLLGEFSIMRAGQPGPSRFDPRAYSEQLMGGHSLLGFKLGFNYQSGTGRYSRLIDDIRNDIVRINPFFDVALRVFDIDRRRRQSLAHVSRLTNDELGNALNRIDENVKVVASVQCALAARASVYRYALERLVIAEPARIAVEAEHALTLLQTRIAQHGIVPPQPHCGAALP